MPGQRKVLDKRGILLVVIAVAVIALILIFSPDAKAIHLQTKAGGIISDYVASLEQTEESEIGVFCCILPTLYPDAPIGTELDQAISWLKEAKSIAPRNEYSSFLLGQVYCLARNYPEAMEELNTFYLRRSDNPLVVAELGFANLSAYLSHPTTDQVENELENAKLLLDLAGFKDKFLEVAGGQAYKKGNYHTALAWFEIAEKVRSPLSEENRRFRASIHTITNPTDEFVLEPSFFIQPKTGEPADVRPFGDQDTAVIWSGSTPIGVIIDVAEPADYCVQIAAFDKEPNPTQLAVFLDSEKIFDFELNEGDGQEKDFSFPIRLGKGAFLISIKLLNDYSVPGVVDRNGYIGRLTIQICN